MSAAEQDEAGPPPPRLSRPNGTARPHRRWLVRRIWRAFPELDGYADADCAHFVRMAQRHTLLRLLRAVVIGSFFAIGLVSAIASSGIVSGLVPGRIEGHGIAMDVAALALLAVVIAVAFAVPVLTGLVARDWLLRRRLRHVLRDSGSCHACGYSLIGLYIPESLTLTCPECGFPCAVDVSLTALARDDAGAGATDGASPGGARPRGSAPVGGAAGDSPIGSGRMVVMEYPRYWTPERSRRWMRRIGSAGLAALVIVCGVAGVFEFWVRDQAAQARAEAPTAADVTAVIARLRPGAELVGAPQSISAMMEIDARMSAINVRTWPGDERTPGVWPGFELVLAPQEDLQDARSPSEQSQSLSLDIAMRLLAAYESEGLFADFEAVREAPAEVRDLRVPPERLFATPLPYLGVARTHARILGARMLLAIHRCDTPIAEESLATIRALARTCDQQPTAVEHLVGSAIDGVAIDRTKRWLASKPDAAELDAIERAWQAYAHGATAALAIEFDALSAKGLIAATLGDASAVRLAPFVGIDLPWPWAAWPGQPPLRAPGTWVDNRDAIEAWRADFAARSLLTPAERSRLSATSTRAGKAAPKRLADVILSSWRDSLFAESDMRRVQDVVIATMIALERWRLGHGAYPESLNQLVPTLLAEHPVDFWSGKPLGYRRTDPASDRLGRGYVLYSLGLERELNESTPVPRTAK